MDFLKFLENKNNYNTSSEVLDDLVKWNVFLITCRNEEEETKTKKFEFNWNEFTGSEHELKKEKSCYSFKNPVTDTDPVDWSWKTIFMGRPSNKYKFHPEFLNKELKSVTIKNK